MKQIGPERKLSEIIEEMAERLLKDPDGGSTMDAARITVLIASAAWNVALGSTDLRDLHLDLLRHSDCGGERPWKEIVSRDPEGLIAGLIEYKRAQYPDDLRRIIGARMTPECTVHVDWVYGDKAAAAQPGIPRPATAAPAARIAHPIAGKLVALMKRHSRADVHRIREVLAGRASAKELDATMPDREAFDDGHPAHAPYAYTQNLMSVVSVSLTELEEMAPFAELIGRAEDTYMPSGPPMSPLTASYFTTWAFFDACVGPSDETVGTTVLDVGEALGMPAEMRRLIELMQRSRMGVYLHEGQDGDLTVLRDLVTDEVRRSVVPSGYHGRAGELWYARVLPPPLPGGSEHVVFTTPYILLAPGVSRWRAYFDRTLPDVPREARLAAGERHMKFGPERSYWNEFVFEGYVNYRTEAIFLAGLPDVPESRPHSRVNRDLL